MKRKLSCFLLAVLILTTGANQLCSQETGNTISSSRVRNIVDNVNGPDSRLVSGTLYRGARQGSVVGHPYFFDEEYKPGYVIIDSLIFDNLLLKYDILENKLVLNTSGTGNSDFLVCINLQKTKRFEIAGHNFIPFPAGKDSTSRWFAESVVEDTLSYLVLKKKELKIDNGAVDFNYKTNDTHFILFKNELHKFNNRRTLFRLFPGFKEELKRFIRQENLVFINKRPENLTRLINYCNILVKNTQ